MNAVTNSPLVENEHVKALFAILTENSRDTNALTALINSVAAMERQLKAAAD